VRKLYYDKEGKPLADVMAWAALHHDPSYVVIKRSDLPSGGVLSTVWLGIDHAFRGIPVIFESLRFPQQDFQERYCTLEEAMAGHAELLERIRKENG
jgi:hypothetical protein